MAGCMGKGRAGREGCEQMSDANKIIHPPVVLDRLVGLLLNQPWHSQCEIVPDYMPPFPSPDTRPTVVVRHNNGTKHPAFLRYSCGPRQGFFWDVYGDDMHSVEVAILAISQAPYPRSVAPIVVSLYVEAAQAGKDANT